MASATRHGMAVTFPPWWYLFIYLHLHAFELLGWQELGQVTGVHSVAWIQSYDCWCSDFAAQRLLWFNLQCHHVPLYFVYPKSILQSDCLKNNNLCLILVYERAFVMRILNVSITF